MTKTRASERGRGSKTRDRARRTVDDTAIKKNVLPIIDLLRLGQSSLPIRLRRPPHVYITETRSPDEGGEGFENRDGLDAASGFISRRARDESGMNDSDSCVSSTTSKIMIGTMCFRKRLINKLFF